MISFFQRIPVILVGSLLLGIGINGFLVPYHLIDGGIIGIALIIHYYFHVPVGLFMVILSIPLCIYTMIYEKTYFYYSIYGLIVSAIFIDLLAPLKTQFHLPILYSAIIGGICIGLGTGLMLRYQVSTGGTDLLAQLISKATFINIGIIIFFIDGLIVTVGFSTLGKITFIFSCLAIISVSLMSSFIVGSPNTRYKR